MLVIAELRHKDVGVLIHERFYELAKHKFANMDATVDTDVELLGIVCEAMK